MAIALFRYGIISSYIISGDESGKSIRSYFMEIQDRVYINPAGKEVRFSGFTMERWYRAYREKGIEGLMPAIRSDSGRSRKISDDVKGVIHYYLTNYPRLPATVIYQKLNESGEIESTEVSLSTITREVSRQKKALKMISPGKDMRRYEREHINEVWCADTCVGPTITVDGVKRKTYIIGFIDDASRYIVGIDIFFADNTINLMAVAKSAVSRFGKCKIWNFDNGPNYASNQMKLLAARIGTAINYNQPYTPTSKRKMEEIELTAFTPGYRKMFNAHVRDMLFSTSAAFRVVIGDDWRTEEEVKCFLVREYERPAFKHSVVSSPVLIIDKDYRSYVIRGLTELGNAKKTMNDIFAKTHDEDLAAVLAEALRKIAFKYPAAFSFERIEPQKGV